MKRLITRSLADKLRVGMQIKSNGDGSRKGDWFHGKIAEICDTYFFVHHNDDNIGQGTIGSVCPDDDGFKYSNKIKFNNKEGAKLVILTSGCDDDNEDDYKGDNLEKTLDLLEEVIDLLRE